MVTFKMLFEFDDDYFSMPSEWVRHIAASRVLGLCRDRAKLDNHSIVNALVKVFLRKNHNIDF